MYHMRFRSAGLWRLRTPWVLSLLVTALVACTDSTAPRAAPVPVLSSVTPDTARLGGTGLTITALGSDFRSESVIRWGGTDLATTYVSEIELRATVPDALLQTPGPAEVTVFTPQPGGGISAARTVNVRYPAPTLASLSTDTATVGASTVTVTITGTGFAPATQVRWNGAARPTTYISPTQVRVTLAATDLAQAGQVQITVFNPEPGGGASAPATFTIFNPVPQITLLPSQGATAGRPGFTITLHGTGFMQGSAVRWNGAARAATYVSPTRLEVPVSSGDVASPGTIPLSVVNPGPGDRVSNTVTFTVRALGATTASVQRVPITGRDLIWEPGTRLLYVSIPSTGGSLGNTVAAIDPATGAITGSVFVGSEPSLMARSDDGKYLYVGLNGANGVRRVDLATFTPGLQWSLGAGEVAGDIEVVPGQSNSVVVARQRPNVSPPLQAVTLYDEGVARPNSSPGHTGGNRIAFTESASVLYGYDNSSSGFGFFTIAVEPSGLRHVTQTGGLISGYYTNIWSAAGRIYATNGTVVDPERRATLGTFATSFDHRSVTVDAAMGRAFFVVDGRYSPAAGGIMVYDINTFQLLGTLPIAGINFDHPALNTTRVVRWGPDGLAFLDLDELIIIRSPIVAP